MKIKQNIPNAITCGNLLCGCIAIVQAFEGNLVWAAYLVGIAAVLDFLDGFAARLLKVSSPIGKDLDSFADMVTFGVVPGVMMYKMLFFLSNVRMFTDPATLETIYSKQNTESDSLIPYIAFLIPVFSAIRLAKFNNDTRQTESFIGLPTPANAIFISSFALIVNWTKNFSLFESISNYYLLTPWFLITVICLFSFLLIAPLPLFALKFKHFKWKENEIRYIFLGLTVILIATLQFVGIPLVIILYILLSIINNLVKKRTSHPQT